MGPGPGAEPGQAEPSDKAGEPRGSPAFVLFVHTSFFFTMSVVLETTRFLSPLLGTRLDLDHLHTALTGAVLPFGACAGAIVGGVISDRHGRRTCCFGFILLLVLVSLSALVLPIEFGPIVALHAAKGVAFGGVIVSVMPWAAEQYPTRDRGRYIAFSGLGWTLGTVATLAGFQVEGVAQQVRLLELFPVLPAVFCAGCLYFARESPRWRSLDRTELEWRLGEVFAAQGTELALHTAAWVSFAGGWYALFFWAPELLRMRAGGGEIDYGFFLWSAVLVSPSFLIAAAVIEHGRKVVFLVFCSAAVVAVAPLGHVDEATCKVLFVLADLFTSLCWTAIAVFATESFPTIYRASAMGWLSALARISAGVLPLLGGYLLAASPDSVAYALAGVFALSAVAVYFLPETAGLDLRDGLGKGEASPLLR